MSDPGRKSVGDQLQEKITPESQKSTLQQAQESVTSAADKIVGAVQPSDTKSTSQEAADTVRGKSDDAEQAGKSYIQQGQEAIGNAVKSASDALGLSSDQNK